MTINNSVEGDCNRGSIATTPSIKPNQRTDNEITPQEANKVRLTISPKERSKPPTDSRKRRDRINDPVLLWCFVPKEYEENLIRAEHTEEVTAKQLAEAIAKGRSWSGATFIDNDPVFYAYENKRCLYVPNKKPPIPIHPGRRAKHNFEQAQVIAVEVQDVSSPYSYAAHLGGLNLEPTFIVSSFDDNEIVDSNGNKKRKFVCVWVLDEPIQTTEAYSFLLRSLLEITNGKITSKATDATRIWLGGKSILYENYNQVTSAKDIVSALSSTKKLEKTKKALYKKARRIEELNRKL